MPTDLTNIVAPERNRYFYGLMMDAEQFQRDQDYFNRKRMLLNRFVTGAGVVAGLGLAWNSSTHVLTLSPGLAIDYAGREIIVPSSVPVNTKQLTDAKGNPTGTVAAGSTILISIAYAEQKIDEVPVLVLDCDQPGQCAPSAIEERYVILVRLATGPPPPIGPCIFGTLPLPPGAALQAAIAGQIAGGFQAIPADPSVPLGRLDLASGTLDAVSDRPVVYNNALLYDLLFCLAGQLSQAAVVLTYVSGDNQSALAGQPLPNPIVVGLVDGDGNPLTTATAPQFNVTSGDGSLSSVTAGPGPGQFQATWTLGSAGQQTVVVNSTQSSITVTFHATLAT
jgi:hypothetical protein